MASGEVTEFNVVSEAEAAVRQDQMQLDDRFVEDVVLGEVRPFWLGFLFTVVTFGIYPLFWHPIVNGEVARQTGSRSTGNVLWLFLLLAGFAAFVSSFVRYGLGSRPPLAQDPVAMVWALIVNGFFIAFVLVQRHHLNRGFEALGVKQRAPVAFFLFLQVLSWILGLAGVLPLDAVAVVLVIFAYAVWQSTYNDFWHAVRKRVAAAERAGAAELDEEPSAFMPT